MEAFFSQGVADRHVPGSYETVGELATRSCTPRTGQDKEAFLAKAWQTQPWAETVGSLGRHADPSTSPNSCVGREEPASRTGQQGSGEQSERHVGMMCPTQLDVAVRPSGEA